MKRNTPAPNLIAETFMATFKIFLIIYLATLAVLAFLYFRAPRNGDARVQITQTDNQNISQKINNG